MDRRQSALIRIVAWSVAAVALLVILLLGLAGRITPIFFGFNTGYYYADSNKYQSGSGKIDGDEVHDLDINWIDGSIRIEVYEGDTVQIFEKSQKNLKEDDQLQYYNKNGRLMIQYQKARKKLLSLEGNLQKELTVKIPVRTAEKMGYVGVDTVSSDTRMDGITADKIDLNSTSGDFELTECRTSKLFMNSTSGSLTGEALYVDKELNTDSTSGNVNVKGSVLMIHSDSTSGSVNVESEACPEKVRTDTVSGSVTLIIPENDGFKFKSDSVSGMVKCDFYVTFENDHGVYKDGGADFSFDSVSGDVSIKPLD